MCGGGYSRPTQMQSAKVCPNFHFQGGGGGGVTPDQLKIQSAKICPNFHFPGGWGWGGPDQLKSKVPRSAQIFIFRVGGGVLQTKIPEILEWGTQGILN